MIFKVYLSRNSLLKSLLEKTQRLFILKVNRKRCSKKVADRDINIEYIQPIKGAYLEYEKQNEDFKVLEI